MLPTAARATASNSPFPAEKPSSSRPKNTLKLIERREYTAAQLKRKLSEAMFPREIVASVIEDLKGRGYLNDGKYARAWIESQLKRKQQGRRLLLHGLIQKGVSREEAERTIGEMFSMIP